MKAKESKHISVSDFKKTKNEKKPYHQITIAEYLDTIKTSDNRKSIDKEIKKLQNERSNEK